MNSWETKTLGELCRKITDGVHHTPKYTDTGIPFLSVKNLTQGLIDFNNTKFISLEDHKVLIKRCKPERQDVLYTKVGTTGIAKVVDTDREFSLFVSVALLKPKHEIIFNKYLEHFLNSKLGRDQARNRTRGMANKNLVIRDISEITINYPVALPEQKRIVAILDEAFEGIDRAIANTEKNLASSRELFESYLNAIFTQKGDGWEEKKLEDICNITSKLVDPRLPEYMDLPHVGAGNMISKTDQLIEVKTAKEEELKSGKFLFDDTMVLYSKIRPYLMKACRPKFSGLCSADVYPLLPNNGQLNRDFLFYLLMSRNFTEYAISGSERAGMPKVNRDHLFRYSAWVPSLSEQINTAQKIDEIASETQRLESIYRQKLSALNELKQSILQKAFTGELTADTPKTLEGKIAA